MDTDGHFAWIPVAIAGGLIGGTIYGYGTQVYDNLKQGKNLGQALTTNIDPGKVAMYAGAGAAIGTGLGLVAVGAEAVAGTAGLLCSDGNCTNEAQGVVRAAEQAAETFGELTGGDPTDELQTGQRILNSTIPKLQHVFSRHASDFSISENWSQASGDKFLKTLQAHVNGSNTRVIQGTYRGTQSVLHYFDPATNLDVMTDLEGNLISAWQLSVKQIEYILSTGNVQ